MHKFILFKKDYILGLQKADGVNFLLSASLYCCVFTVMQSYYGLITRCDHTKNGLGTPFTGESGPSRYA